MGGIHHLRQRLTHGEPATEEWTGTFMEPEIPGGGQRIMGMRWLDATGVLRRPVSSIQHLLP